MISGFILASSASLPSVGLLPVEQVTLESRDLRLEQVADLSGLPNAVQMQVAKTVIAKFPSDKQAAVVSSLAFARWARLAVPKLKIQPSQERQILINFEQNPNSERRSNGNCWSTEVAIDADQIISQADVLLASCAFNKVRAAVYFDRDDRLVRAAQSLSAGDYLGRIKPAADDVSDRGNKLVFVTTDGPVQVSRQVRALQTAKSGKSLFVASADGKVIKTTYRATKGQRDE